MASMKADYDGLMVQEFLSKAQAMAYTNFKRKEDFDLYIDPYCHHYMNSDKRSVGDYYIPELRKRKIELAIREPLN